MTTVALVHDRTLQELRATRRAMVGTTWEMALESRPPAVQIAAVKTLLNLGKAIRALEDAAPLDCGDRLAVSEAALSAGIADLARARAASTGVEEVLAEADRVLGILQKVVEFRPI